MSLPRALRLFALVLVLLAAQAGAAARAGAQTPVQWKSNVVASVTVAPPPILLQTTRSLYFGSVSAGSNVSVPAQPPYTTGTWSAGARFSNMAKTARYGVTLTLPTALSKGSGPTLPVSWTGTQYGWVCVWNATSQTAASCGVMQQNFSPSSHTTTPLVIDLPNNTPQNNVFSADVYVGGRLTVPNQPIAPGVYSAPIRITLAAIN